MRTIVTAAAISALATVVQAGAEPAAPSTPGQLPTLRGDNLNSRTMMLPTDLPADPSLLLIPFDQDQQHQVDSWTKNLQDSMSVPWIELPIIEPSNAFVRAMIAAGMRRDIPEAKMRERVVTVYTAPDPVARAIGCVDYKKRLCVAVVEKSGRIRLVLTGNYSDEGARQVLEQIATVSQSAGSAR